MTPSKYKIKPTSVGTVKIGQGDVAIRRSTSSSVTVAKLLGDETRDGVRVLYLDRLVHTAADIHFSDWHPSGAVSTMLTYRPDTDQNDTPSPSKAPSNP